MIKNLFFMFVMLLSVNAGASVYDVIAKNRLRSEQVSADKHFWLDLAAKSNSSLEEKGLLVGVGYRAEFFGGDVRLSYGRTEFGAIRGLLDYNQAYSDGISHDPWIGNEQLRPRPSSDPWSYFLIEPGLSVEGKLFPYVFPLLTERARVGFGYGRFFDQANALSFTGYLYTVEAAFIYQLGPQSPWSLAAALFWNTGSIKLSTVAQGATDSDRSVAVSWVGTSLGLLYSF